MLAALAPQINRQFQVQTRYPQRGDNVVGQAVARQVKGGGLVGKGVFQAALALGKKLLVVGQKRVVQFGVGARGFGGGGFGRGGRGGFGGLHKIFARFLCFSAPSDIG